MNELNDTVAAVKAIQKLIPGALFTLSGDFEWVEVKDAAGKNTGKFITPSITWLDNRQFPLKGELEAAIKEVKEEFIANQYQSKRAEEYPPLTELADAIYWQSQGDNTKMQKYLDAVQAVKDRYPKGVV